MYSPTTLNLLLMRNGYSRNVDVMSSLSFTNPIKRKERRAFNNNILDAKSGLLSNVKT